jgi:transposase
LTDQEGRQVIKMLHQGKDAIAVRRAEIVLASAQGEGAPSIARRLHFTADYVRKVIHAFNDSGVASLKAQYANGGRPREILPEHESEVVELALTPPRLTGQPFTHWTLETLRDVAARRRLIPRKISIESVRQILKKHRVSLQRTKTWKESTDPEFEEKKTPSSGSTSKRARARRR